MKNLKQLLCAFSLLFFLNSNAQSLIRIPQDAATLSAAVQLAQSGDTISLAAGTYSDSAHISSKSLIIKGDPNGGSILSPGTNEKSFVLQNADVEFVQLEFDDFQLNSPPPNFAISANNSNIKIKQCRFNNLFSPLSLFWGHLEISNSIFSGTRGNAGIQHNGGTFSMYNNLIYRIEKTAVSINRAHGQFFNNTLVGSTPTQHYGVIINSDSISHFYNNIFDGFGVGIQLTASDSFELAALRIYNNNIYNGAAPYWYEYNESLSLPIYSGALSPNPGTGEISISSHFVDSTNGDFRIKSTSPCRDAGINAYTFPVSFDLDGNNRITGTNPDIGAYEYFVPTGLNEIYSDIELEIYPQPTQHHVWLKFKKNYSGTLELLSVSGQVLERTEIKNSTKRKVDLPESNGMYFLRLINTEGIAVRRILKEE